MQFDVAFIVAIALFVFTLAPWVGMKGPPGPLMMSAQRNVELQRTANEVVRTILNTSGTDEQHRARDPGRSDPLRRGAERVRADPEKVRATRQAHP
ncbi:hypothetical protein [Actinopolymorpha pittospori]|uniref:Uncharacterized protein n=1 Tax=Actinopolymorpha pittospori TaxID=648752 RepID=A0A927N764_9ACTN|nr:hypothetical protein [Actinopolymorpha pittospori]MBE1612248.1 hypothetical protein [Actinopolymorpha pittospori]